MGTVSCGRTRGGGWSSGVLGECRPRARVTCLYTFLRTDLAICPRRVSRCFPPSPAPSKYDEEGNSMLNRLYGAGRSEALYPSPTVEISLFSSPLGHHSDAWGNIGKQRDQTSSPNTGKGLSVLFSSNFLPQALFSSGVVATRMRTLRRSTL